MASDPRRTGGVVQHGLKKKSNASRETPNKKKGGRTVIGGEKGIKLYRGEK